MTDNELEHKKLMEKVEPILKENKNLTEEDKLFF